jgi:uncharacterized protein YegJ (DUF2314 family)
VFYIIALLLIVLVLWGGMKLLRLVGGKPAAPARSAAPQREFHDPVYVLLMRSEPLTLTEDAVANAYEQTFGKRPKVKTVPWPSETAIASMAPGLPGVTFRSANAPKSNRAGLEQIAARLQDPETKQAVLNHRAWLMCEAVADEPPPKDPDLLLKVHMMLGRVASAFVDDKTTVVMLPLLSRAVSVRPDTRERLFSMSLAELYQIPNGDAAAYFSVGKDDQVAKAMQEAQRRLPEFKNHISSPASKEHTMLKVRFKTDQGHEYVWTTCTSLEGDRFVGEIVNDTIDPTVPVKGSRVLVEPKDVVDWVYVDEQGTPQGFFVERVLMQRSKQ